MWPVSPGKALPQPTSAPASRPRLTSRTSTRSFRSSSKATNVFVPSWSVAGLSTENGAPSYEGSPVLYLQEIGKRLRDSCYSHQASEREVVVVLVHQSVFVVILAIVVAVLIDQTVFVIIVNTEDLNISSSQILKSVRAIVSLLLRNGIVSVEVARVVLVRAIVGFLFRDETVFIKVTLVDVLSHRRYRNRE